MKNLQLYYLISCLLSYIFYEGLFESLGIWYLIVLNIIGAFAIHGMVTLFKEFKEELES